MFETPPMVKFEGGVSTGAKQGEAMPGTEAGTGPIANMIGSQLARKSSYRPLALPVVWTVNDTVMTSPA